MEQFERSGGQPAFRHQPPPAHIARVLEPGLGREVAPVGRADAVGEHHQVGALGTAGGEADLDAVDVLVEV